jgi:hypothetical protein
MRSRESSEHFPCHTVVDGENGRFVVPVGRISLDGVYESVQLGSQTFLDSILCPVDAETPVPRSGSGTFVLLEHGDVDSSLVEFSVSDGLQGGEPGAHLLEHLAHQQSSRTFRFGNYCPVRNGFQCPKAASQEVDRAVPAPMTKTLSPSTGRLGSIIAQVTYRWY